MDDLLRRKILALLGQHRTMRIATLRLDGWPQVTTVGYANDGLTIYFLCGLDSQKASNLACDDRVSLAIDNNSAQVMDITGLSMAARATVVADHAEAEKAIRASDVAVSGSEGRRRPDAKSSEVRIFRLTPSVVSVLDYSEIWAHRPRRLLKDTRHRQNGGSAGKTASRVAKVDKI